MELKKVFDNCNYSMTFTLLGNDLGAKVYNKGAGNKFIQLKLVVDQKTTLVDLDIYDYETLLGNMQLILDVAKEKEKAQKSRERKIRKVIEIKKATIKNGYDK